ncbi:hypothetical protein [Xanthobacter sp. KR7-225]|uniref:hypothetical protein n=1 Tax=Xanthobacter sp. KR7-225 TaxID=3156613 RepID=UPI0032B40EE1
MSGIGECDDRTALVARMTWGTAVSSEAIELLNEAFQEGRPVVLFAGQGFDLQGTATDPVLSSLSRRLGVDEGLASWSAALRIGLSAADTDWLAERFSRSVPTEGALAAYELPWAAAFTLSIDPNFPRRLETRGRQPEAVLAAGTFARVPRSRSRPPVHFILGKAGETASDAAPPIDVASLKRRMARHGVELLNRIAETATARGVIVIAGFNPAGDWIDIDDLLAPLSDRAGSKIVWFGALDTTDSAFAADMVKAGSLLIEPYSLANAIAGPGANWTRFSASATPDEPSMVTLASGILDITPAVRLRVEASAAVVDDGWTSGADPIQPRAVESAFRRFHGDLAGFRGRVEGIAHGFAFRREFEHHLIKVIEAALRRRGESDGVVIVHGQSGTGKSIALARLARELRLRLRLPVVVSTTRVPAHADLDAFCAEAERADAVATVLLCDTNEPVQRYLELASAMRSRGRRLLIVGTSYRVERHLQTTAGQHVEAPAAMSDGEISDLRALLARFAPDLPEPRQHSAEEGNTLAMLYRLIAQGREHIRSRVNAEARFAERGIRQRALRAPRPPARSQLAESLIAAGIVPSTSSLFVEDESAAALGLDAAGRLIDYVMAPGRLNCPVPLNLLMRMLTRHSGALELEQILHVFADLDIFRWHSSNNEGTELLISPRLQLEAELICRSRLGDVRTEIQRLVELIGSIEASGVDRETERSFLMDLLQKLDRHGPRNDAYREGYLDFAKALTKLRTERGVVEGPLIVRECTFRRQAIWAQDGRYQTNSMDEGHRLKILDEARSIVEEAFRLIGSGALQASKRTRQNLASERASIYGYLAVQRSRLNDVEGAWADYLAAKTASTRAIALSGDYHPVDIALWTSSDLLEELDMLPERRAEVIADIYAGLDLVDVETLGGDQRARYFERKTKAGDLVGNAELSFEAIAGLEGVAPAAASFLIARRIAEPLESADKPYTAGERALAREAADFISGRRDQETADDPRCARLLLRLRWAEATGQRLLSSQRGLTPGEPGQVANLLTIITGINERAGLDQRNSERYLEAVLAWMSRDFHRSSEIWRSLSRDSEFEDRARVVRRLIASGADGVPLRFRGRVEGVKGDADWKVRIEGFNTTVNLLVREFADQDLAHGRELRDFGVAFNYVGPIADPLTRSGIRR